MEIKPRNIREVCKLVGLTGKDLARQSRLNEGVVSQILSGKLVPSADQGTALINTVATFMFTSASVRERLLQVVEGSDD